MLISRSFVNISMLTTIGVKVSLEISCNDARD